MKAIFTTIMTVLMVGLIVFIWSPANTGTIGQYVPTVYRIGETIVSLAVFAFGIKINVIDN